MGQVKAVIFDFGGVLVRMTDDRPRVALAKQLGVSLSTLDNLVFFSESAQQASLGTISVSRHWEAVRAALGINQEDMPGFLERYWSADDVNWTLLDFIRTLRPRYKVGLLSNAWDDLRLTLHNRWNIDGLFDELVISAEVGVVKPDARIFKLAHERLGVQPEEAIFLDDIAENVTAAQVLGMIALRFTNTQEAIAGIQRYIEESAPSL